MAPGPPSLAPAAWPFAPTDCWDLEGLTNTPFLSSKFTVNEVSMHSRMWGVEDSFFLVWKGDPA